MGKKLACFALEVAMMVSDDHTAPSIIICSSKCPVNVYLDQVLRWWLPVLHRFCSWDCSRFLQVTPLFNSKNCSKCPWVHLHLMDGKMKNKLKDLLCKH
jgi:hypothetical protein